MTTNHTAEPRDSYAALIAALQQHVGETVVVQHRHWENGGLAEGSKTGELLDVDTYWPSIVLDNGSRIPFGYIITVRTAGGVLVWNEAS